MSLRKNPVQTKFLAPTSLFQGIHLKRCNDGDYRRGIPIGTRTYKIEIAGKDLSEDRFRNDALMEKLDACYGIVLGCATYMGSGSAIFKAFLEAAFRPHWLEQRWKDKVAAGFTNSASQNGDKFATLLQLVVFAMQMGMIWVGVGNNWSGGSPNDLNRLGTWMDAMGQSNADEPTPSIGDIDTAERFGLRVALICRRFRDGTEFGTERLSEIEFANGIWSVAIGSVLSGVAPPRIVDLARWSCEEEEKEKMRRYYSSLCG